MRFENVSSLIESLAPEAGAMGFHWRDTNGPICNQKGVFRVNCMDCLDRTNVVQTAIGKAVLESQLVKLGLAMPYSQLPDALKAPFMVLWANNGDVISRQYAGTNALKVWPGRECPERARVCSAAKCHEHHGDAHHRTQRTYPW